MILYVLFLQEWNKILKEKNNMWYMLAAQEIGNTSDVILAPWLLALEFVPRQPCILTLQSPIYLSIIIYLVLK